MVACPNKDCKNMASVLEEVERGVLEALRHWLSDYKLDLTSAKLSTDTAGASVQALERTVARLSSALATLQTQRNSLFDLLEQGVYNKETFLERSRILAAKTAETEAALAEAAEQLETEKKLAEKQLSILPRVERVLELYDRLETPKEKNDLLKEVLQKVVYNKTTGSRWIPSDMMLAVFPRVK
jgi:chromosome segregation ATPase